MQKRWRKGDRLSCTKTFVWRINVNKVQKSKIFSHTEKIISVHLFQVVPFLPKASRFQAPNWNKRSSWSIRIMFSSATPVVRWGLLQPWHRKRLWGLRSSVEHELLGFSPLTEPYSHHPNIHLLWKSWKRNKPATPHRLKKLVLGFSSPATRQMKKLVSQYLTVWFMPCLTPLWVQTDTGKNSSMGAKV